MILVYSQRSFEGQLPKSMYRFEKNGERASTQWHTSDLLLTHGSRDPNQIHFYTNGKAVLYENVHILSQ